MIRKMTYSNCLNTKKLLSECESNHRLFAPLLCYLFANQYQCVDNPEMKICLEDLYSVIDQYQEDVLLSYLQNSQNEELKKYANSFESENQRRDDHELKDKYRELFKQYQVKFNLSDYYLCKLAKMNSGNFNSFYKHNKNNCMSLKKCELLLDELNKNYQLF